MATALERVCRHKRALLIGIAVISPLCFIYSYEKISTIGRINSIKEAVSNEFIDPDSVKFKNLRAYSYYDSVFEFVVDSSDIDNSIKKAISLWEDPQMYKNISEPVLCGEVNAKNKFGAYVGYKKFYANKGLVFFEDRFGDLVSHGCTGNGMTTLFYPMAD